ncbi:hypothetical protein BGZ51_004342 [Haplosporangium sp. Z 767]|nr:hypothetical protein BGZ51_004342 [Haplosporangium sp. Z 767]KAF9183221.1 hypothetical protein BGZ50_004375 [Haplosporangium sp. Z 11]
MSKDKRGSPQLNATSKRHTADSEGKDSSTKVKAKHRDIEDAESLAAIQQKVSEFQPKIDALFPRMLNRTIAPTATRAESNRSRAPIARKDNNIEESSRMAAEGPSNNKDKGSSTKPSTRRSSAAIGTSTTNPNSATTKAKSARATVAPASSATSTAKPKSKSGAVATSIAELIPRRSRAKPLPAKTTATMNAPPLDLDRKENPTEDTIILLSSQPSLPSSLGQRIIDLGVKASSVETGSDDDNSVEDDNGLKDHHDDDEEPLIDRRMTDSKKDHSVFQPGSHISTPSDVDMSITDVKAELAIPKQPSVMSIRSSKSDMFASLIPSVEANRIAQWMGGVKEAMEQDATPEESSSAIPTAATRINDTAHVKGQGMGKNVYANNIKNDTTAATVMDTKGSNAADIMERPKHTLRRPPHRVPKLVGVSERQTNSPSPIPPRPSPPPGIVECSLGEDEMATPSPLWRAEQQSTENNYHNLDSAPVPPVSHFHNDPDSNMNRGPNKNESVGAALSPTKTSTKAIRVDLTQDTIDDRTTVLGQQPTQDSLTPLQSVPSFMREKSNDVEEMEMEGEMNRHYGDRQHGQRRQQERPQHWGEPSLPSELTSSCYQELGLTKKRRDSGKAGKRSRRRRSGSSFSLADRSGDEDKFEDDVILNQREVFPSSLGAAPASLSPSPSLYNVLEAPVYSPALPDRTRPGNLEAEGIEQSLGHEKDIFMQDPSFPSPPSLISLSSLPKLPTMPTFPNTLQSEPSLVILGSQDHDPSVSGEDVDGHSS